MKMAALSQVCEITMGQAPKGDTYNDIGEGLPLIAGAGDFGDLYPSPKKFTTAKAVRKSEPGDVIVGIRASIGDKVLADDVYCLGRGVAGLRAGPGLDQRYLWNWVTHAAPTLAAKGRGATFLQVNKADVSEMEIPLPPIEEQRRIAAVLDAADALRAKRRQALAKLDTLTQAIFIDMFGDPVAAATRFGCLEMGEMGRMTNGHNFSAEDRGDGTAGILMLDVKNMYTANAHPDVESAYRISAEVPDSKQLQPGDLVFVRSSVKREGVAWPVHFTGHSEPVALCGFLIRLRLHTEMARLYTPEYLVHYLRQPSVRMAAVASAGQVAITNVSQKRLGQLRIPKAPMATQVRFSERISKIYSLREFPARSLEEANNLFASLQQRAFRGEL